LALRGLGDVGRLVGEYDRSREYHTQALALARNSVTDAVKPRHCGGWAMSPPAPKNVVKPLNFGGRRLRSMKNSAFRSPRTVRSAMSRLDCDRSATDLGTRNVKSPRQ
jgi:hypothetical protein